jgi:hypothetical protein
MPLEPRGYFCAGRYLSAETAEDVNPNTYFTESAETPDACPNCGHNLHEFKETLPNKHRSNIVCPSCGVLSFQQRYICGWDLTPVMEHVPYDGHTYLVTCPNPLCGNISRVSWPPGVDYGPPGDPPAEYNPADFVQPYTP